ncbi:Helix-turn-helix domain protein [compost metagenome]
MAFPSKERTRKALKHLEKSAGTLSLAANPTALEKFRWDICQHFLTYKRKNKCTQKQMAELVDIDESKISKILHHRIDEFSTDRLISIYEKLNPRVQLRVS